MISRSFTPVRSTNSRRFLRAWFSQAGARRLPATLADPRRSSQRGPLASTCLGRQDAVIEFEAVRFQEVKLSDARSASGRGRAITLRGFRGGGEGLLFFREHF